MTNLSSTDSCAVRPSRAELVDRYRRNRARSRQLFALLSDEAYYGQPIALRHPIVFYEGHLPGFSFNTLVKKALGGSSIDARLERLFARGIDPHESAAAGSHPPTSPGQWPSREVVRAFVAEADGLVIDALQHADIEQPGHPLLDRGEAVFAILEHEEMHHETLLYMLHRLPFSQKATPWGYQPRTEGAPAPAQWIHVPTGRATLGVDRAAVPFGWDNECPAWSVDVPSFEMERHDVTNGRFLEFVEAGGYRDARWWTADDWQWRQTEGLAHPLFWERVGQAWSWRGMFGLIPLPASWPVYVSLAEASAFARWRGARLPTEGEFQRAAYGSPDGERRYPWGGDAPTPRHGVFDFASWDPEPAGSHPDGVSAWGVEDLVGNGWEWTGSPFAPFPGFREIASYPEYSADFFDGEHFVMKGASPATVGDLLRPTFRNWFRRRYPYVYATFRCVKSE
jgi:gamma-glutamyl hercynylcysteine S-oxide synthase